MTVNILVIIAKLRNVSSKFKEHSPSSRDKYERALTADFVKPLCKQYTGLELVINAVDSDYQFSVNGSWCTQVTVKLDGAYFASIIYRVQDDFVLYHLDNDCYVMRGGYTVRYKKPLTFKEVCGMNQIDCSDVANLYTVMTLIGSSEQEQVMILNNMYSLLIDLSLGHFNCIVYRDLSKDETDLIVKFANALQLDISIVNGMTLVDSRK